MAADALFEMFRGRLAAPGQAQDNAHARVSRGISRAAATLSQQLDSQFARMFRCHIFSELGGFALRLKTVQQMASSVTCAHRYIEGLNCFNGTPAIQEKFHKTLRKKLLGTMNDFGASLVANVPFTSPFRG